MRLSVCSATTSTSVNQGKTCGVSLPDTAMQNCVNFSLGKQFRRSCGTCRSRAGPYRVRVWRKEEELVTSLFPMFLKLEGRQCLVVGAGKVGESKIGSLLETGAHIRVVALEASPAVQEWARSGKIDLELRAVVDGDLGGVFLAVVATNSRTLDATLYPAAKSDG